MDRSYAFMNESASMSKMDKDSIYLMIHADDAGLCHSENRATIECLEKGSVNSCSVMVNCTGFEEMAAYLRENPRFDHGIHLTLTCEWHQERFGPVLSPSEVPSLVDADGHFFKNRKTLLENAKPEEVRREVWAQIQRGLDFGLQPSHIDSHMYSMGVSESLFRIYREAGREFGIPVLINRGLLSDISGLNPKEVLGPEDFEIPFVHYGDFSDFQQNKLEEFYQNTLENLGPGLHMLLIHPAFDDEEMRRITWDHPNFGSAWRQVDTDFFTSAQCRQIIEERNIELVSWGELKSFRSP